MTRAVLLLLGLVASWSASAQEYADFDWKLSSIILAAPEFSGTAPIAAKRRPQGVMGGDG